LQGLKVFYCGIDDNQYPASRRSNFSICNSISVSGRGGAEGSASAGRPLSSESVNFKQLRPRASVGQNLARVPYSLTSADALGHNFVVTSNGAFSYNID
jgi:hypothetical protein